jgi:hypothetical protein
MAEEDWRPVPGFEGLYEISASGDVRTIARILRRRNGRKYTVAPLLRKPVPNRYGYLGVRLSKDGATFPKEIHALVALAFLGPRPAGADIRHLDGNKVNNSASNLKYGTRSENILDAVAHGTHGMTRKTHCAQGHPFDAMNTRETGRQRVCRICARKRGREHAARKRSEKRVLA